MRKSFKFRLYPSKSQKKSLQGFLDACRWTFNKTLELRKKTYEETGKGLSLYETNNYLPEFKKDNPNLNNAHSQCLQNAQQRVDLAFKAFFRRVKKGEKLGYPRFRGFDRYDSFTFPQSGFKLINGQLELSKIGLVKIFKHRELQGQIKTVTIRRSPTGKWFACFSCKIESPKPLPSIEKIAGIDMGLTSFATLSTGEKIENPRFFRKAERDIAKAQRKLSKCSKGTPARKRAKYALGHIYEKISNRRQNFAHKTANKLIKEFQIIILEKLNIIKMTENGFKGINKSIQDASWKQFIDILSFKAECAGRKVIFVDPRNTSKMCSRCGQIVEKNLSERVHSCTCGCVMDRDHNASLNILRLGTQSLAIS